MTDWTACSLRELACARLTFVLTLVLTLVFFDTQYGFSAELVCQ